MKVAGLHKLGLEATRAQEGFRLQFAWCDKPKHDVL